jgi:hypothetical protein
VVEGPVRQPALGVDGKLAISRTHYGHRDAALKTGGVLIGEKVVLEFEASAITSA